MHKIEYQYRTIDDNYNKIKLLFKAQCTIIMVDVHLSDFITFIVLQVTHKLHYRKYFPY